MAVKIGGTDVIDNAQTLSWLKVTNRPALKGVAGPKGPVGPNGPVGPTGPKGNRGPDG